jgi:hypothetical protein
MRNWIRMRAKFTCKTGYASDFEGYDGQWDDDADSHPWYQPAKDGLNYVFEWTMQSSGSVHGDFTIIDVDCCKKRVNFDVHLSDAFRMGSATRVPGWVPWLGDTELLPDTGPWIRPFTPVYRSVTLEWNWNETIDF